MTRKESLIRRVSDWYRLTLAERREFRRVLRDGSCAAYDRVTNANVRAAIQRVDYLAMHERVVILH